MAVRRATRGRGTVERARGRATLATALGLAGLATLTALAAPAFAQGWWPWSTPEERPVPREPVYRDPPPEGEALPPGGAAAPPGPQGAPGPQAPPQSGWGAGSRNSICLDLERRLVQEGQRGSGGRERLPAIEAELRQVDQTYREGVRQLERMDCYDYFFFSKTLRKTRRCVDQAAIADDARRRVAELEAQRQEISSNAGRSYKDEIVRELARNGCGSSYEQQARRQNTNPFSSFWEEEDSNDVGGGLGTYGNVPYATYRTLCVRLCDGYYFPISFSTLPNHFQRDAEACQSKCAAPTDLYYYQNPGSSVDQAVAASSSQPYTQLKTAFRYRKEFVQGCSCKLAEYTPDPKAPGGFQPPLEQQGAAQPDGGGAAAGVAPGAVQPGLAQQRPASPPYVAPGQGAPPGQGAAETGRGEAPADEPIDERAAAQPREQLPWEPR